MFEASTFLGSIRSVRLRLINRDTVIAEQSLFFYSQQTLAGSKLKVYVLLKILKLLVQTRTKITSFMMKFALDTTLTNMTPTDDDIAECIETVMKNFRIRDQFQLN